MACSLAFGENGARINRDARIFELAGGHARDEAMVIDRLVAEMRLASFRRYLHATVTEMSSIIPDVLALVGTDVSSALQRIRPSHLWPANTIIGPSTGTRKMGRARRADGSLRSTSSHHHTGYQQTLNHVGDAVIQTGLFDSWVKIAVVGSTVNVVMRGAGFELSTAGNRARIDLASQLPETTIAACAGRPLDQVVDHPLFRGREYVVEDMRGSALKSAIEFDVKVCAVQLPWPA